jgi:uncharacterized protein
MACIDVDSLAQFECDARQGRAEALYNLGLAYSTGQGVNVDFIAAHKWFNLAAMKGSELAKTWRAQISREMNSGQIAEAQRQAREWLSYYR